MDVDICKLFYDFHEYDMATHSTFGCWYSSIVNFYYVIVDMEQIDRYEGSKTSMNEDPYTSIIVSMFVVNYKL